MSVRPVDVEDAGKVYRRLLGYARPHLGMFMIGVVGMLLFAATDSALAFLVQKFLAGAFVEPDPRIIWAIPLGAVGLFLLRGIGDYVSNYFPGWVGRQVIKSMRGELFAHYLRLPVRYYEQAATGDLLSRLTLNIERVAEATTKSLPARSASAVATCAPNSSSRSLRSSGSFACMRAMVSGERLATRRSICRNRALAPGPKLATNGGSIA